MSANEDIKIRTQELQRCMVCGSSGNALYRHVTDQLFRTPGDWTIKRCANPECGLLWLDPMPIADDLHLAYRDYYTHQEIASESRKSARRLIIKRIHGALSAAMGFYSAKRERDFRYLRTRPPGRLLDVGCGAGDYLAFMRDHGWEAEGLDFDAEAIQSARARFGVNVHSRQLEEMNYPDAHFDAITMNHMIEHAHDPARLLQECRRVLKPDGLAIVTTPNSCSLGHRIHGKYWRGLEPPRHLHIFSPASLSLLAKRAVFDNVDVFTSGVNSGYFFKESFRIERMETYNIQGDGDSVPMIVWVKAACLELYELWKLRSDSRIGEEVVMICRGGDEKLPSRMISQSNRIDFNSPS